MDDDITIPGIPPPPEAQLDMEHIRSHLYYLIEVRTGFTNDGTLSTTYSAITRPLFRVDCQKKPGEYIMRNFTFDDPDQGLIAFLRLYYTPLCEEAFLPKEPLGKLLGMQYEEDEPAPKKEASLDIYQVMMAGLKAGIFTDEDMLQFVIERNGPTTYFLAQAT